MSRHAKAVELEEPSSESTSKVESISAKSIENSPAGGKSDPVELIRFSPVSDKEASKAKLKKFIDEETKLVKGRFRNFENPGNSLRVQVRKYPGIPSFDKVMNDNEMYEIPLYVARHLNGVDITATAINGKTNSCAWPTHGFTWTGNGPIGGTTNDDRGIPVPIIGVTKWNRRFGFESMEFDVCA